jgi:arylsulfatase
MNSLSRRAWLQGLGALAVPGQVRRPNIILVLTDDQGYGDIARHGNPVVETPHLDRLHDESVRFTDFHVSPTCAPTRTALMTGRHEFRSGVTHTIQERERMSLRSATLAETLKRAGYTTGIFGKWHLGDEDAYQPGRRGFDEAFIHGCGGIGQDYPGSCADVPGNSYFDPVIRHNGRFVKTRGYCTDVFFGQAQQWMDKVRASRAPFFAYIATNAPHEPLQCPAEYIDRYRGRVPNENVAKFFGMVTNIDDNVGRLVSSLQRWGVDRNTLLIFMTDNGGTLGVSTFNDGLRGAKNTPWQGGTRVPAFFRWPGTLAPRALPQLAAHIDLLPTLAEIAGAQLRRPVEGRTLTGLLRNNNLAWPDRYLFTHIGRWPKGQARHYKYAHCRVRGTHHSLVNPNRGPDGWELYDLRTDRGEQANLIATPEGRARHEAVWRPMVAAYDRWWDEIQPSLENEDAVPPPLPPFKEAYWRQSAR